MRILVAASLSFLALGAFHTGTAAPRPSVVIVTIDTLRADAVDGMPELRRFLASATRFDGARAVAPITLATHLSLMTGLSPASHGIQDNIAPPLPRERGFPLLAEEFHEAGYATAAFVASAVLAPTTGIAEGFDSYDAPEQELTGEERLPAALDWLSARDAARPFFLWLHLFDPHAPYRPAAGDLEVRTARELYEVEVRRADAAFGRLLEALPANTIVVVASDHGEGLGDHGEATHGPLCFGSVVDAVLAVRAPALGRGAVDNAPRTLADVAPSLRQWCRLPQVRSDGLRLDRAPEPDRIALTESLYAWRMHGWGQSFAATDGRFTLVESGASLALFDRSVDPGEEQPLDPAEHEAGERLERALTVYRSHTVVTGGDGMALGDVASPYGMARRPCSAYLSRRDNAKLVDSRERFRYWEILASTSQLLSLAAENRDPMLLTRALGMLSALVDEDPKDPAPHTYRAHAMKLLASVTGARRWTREAASATRRAIELGYRTAPLLLDAIDLSVRCGDEAEMRATCELATASGIRLDARGARALAALAAELALRADGRVAAARTTLGSALPATWLPNRPGTDG